jgi:hypothetical protein
MNRIRKPNYRAEQCQNFDDLKFPSVWRFCNESPCAMCCFVAAAEEKGEGKCGQSKQKQLKAAARNKNISIGRKNEAN